MRSLSLIKITAACIIGLMLSTVLHATSTYPIRLTKLMDKKENVIGTLTPATKLKILKVNDDKTKVRISGWSAYGAETIIFKDVGQRIILGFLDESVIKQVKKGKTTVDEFESEWNESSFVGWVKTKDLTKIRDNVWKEANKLFVERCGACHQAHPPHEFTANQWPNILKAMKDRAGLTQNNQWLLTKYMQEHAKDIK